jgi:hypothetical protein
MTPDEAVETINRWLSWRAVPATVRDAFRVLLAEREGGLGRGLRGETLADQLAVAVARAEAAEARLREVEAERDALRETLAGRGPWR